MFSPLLRRPAHSCWRRVCVGVAWISLVSPVLAAAPLDFAQALAIALQQAPEVQADAAKLEAARQAAIAAGALPDPKLALGVNNLPISGSNQYRIGAEPMTMRSIGISQQFPSVAKRSAANDVAAGRIGEAKAAIRVTRSQVATALALAWIDRAKAERQLRTLTERFRENSLLARAVKAQLSAGQGKSTDVLTPALELAQLQELQDRLQSQRSQATARLRRWLGDAAERDINTEVPGWSIDAQQLQRALPDYPQLQLYEARAQTLDAQVVEAQATKIPDWGLQLAYQQRGPQFGDMISVQVSVDLPLFSASRQDPQIASRQAQRVALEAERETMLREQTARLAEDLAELRRLQQALQRQTTDLIPLAQQRVELALAAWRGGTGSLTDLVAARAARIDADLRLIELDAQHQQLSARLFYTAANTRDMDLNGALLP